MTIISKFKGNVEFKNFSWLVVGKVLQMILSLIVGLLTARYLGPANYGIINYSTAYLTFCLSFCTLGITAIIVKNFTDRPDEVGTAIGTTLLLRLAVGIISIALVTLLVAFIDSDEPLVIYVTFLVCISLIFHPFDTFNYWFQYKYNAKVISIVSFISCCVLSLYRVMLLVNNCSIEWFAFACSVDYIVLGILMLIAYRQHSGPKLKYSSKKAKELLSQSYHFILSSIMIVIYGYSDKIMLKQMLADADVGYYSIATNICAMWTFVLYAVVDAMYPTIMNVYKGGDFDLFLRKNRQLYAIVFYISVFASIFITLGSPFIIQLLYGVDYLPASPLLQLVTWYTAFSFLGVARNAWLVCEKRQKYLKYIYTLSAVINVVLNFWMIPVIGAIGAALASLITQIFSCLLLPYIFKPLRINVHLMAEAICLKNVF